MFDQEIINKNRNRSNLLNNRKQEQGTTTTIYQWNPQVGSGEYRMYTDLTTITSQGREVVTWESSSQNPISHIHIGYRVINICFTLLDTISANTTKL